MLKRLWCKIWGHEISYVTRTTLNKEESKEFDNPKDLVLVKTNYYNICPRCGRKIR
jgi:hypothetical protein